MEKLNLEQMENLEGGVACNPLVFAVSGKCVPFICPPGFICIA